MEPPPSPLPNFLRNPNIKHMDQDVLYHLALDNKTHDLKDMFKDVKVQWRHSLKLDGPSTERRDFISVLFGIP